MRFVVLLLGLVGCFLTAVTGAVYLFFDSVKAKSSIIDMFLDFADPNPTRTGVFLIIGEFLGIAGACLLFSGSAGRGRCCCSFRSSVPWS